MWAVLPEVVRELRFFAAPQQGVALSLVVAIAIFACCCGFCCGLLLAGFALSQQVRRGFSWVLLWIARSLGGPAVHVAPLVVRRERLREYLE